MSNCMCVFVQTHNHAEMWSKYTRIVFQGCTDALAGFPQHMPNRKHYRVCSVYRLASPKHHHLFSVSLCCYIHFSSSTSLPSSNLNFHWRFVLFPVSFSNSLQCLCLSHTPEPLKDNSFPGSDSYATPPSHLLSPFPLTPFITSSCQLKWYQIRVVFLGFSFSKRRRAQLAWSWQSSSELTSQAGLEQINRTKLIIDFNHYQSGDTVGLQPSPNKLSPGENQWRNWDTKSCCQESA